MSPRRALAFTGALLLLVGLVTPVVYIPSNYSSFFWAGQPKALAHKTLFQFTPITASLLALVALVIAVQAVRGRSRFFGAQVAVAGGLLATAALGYLLAAFNDSHADLLGAIGLRWGCGVLLVAFTQLFTAFLMRDEPRPPEDIRAIG